jgi:type IX secretion system PorP/SprF family membrane protein
MKNRHVLSFVAAVVMSLPALAQDFHYSLWHMSPLTLNPANTGAYTGDVRVVNNYRMQWFTVTTPFKTLSAGVDAPIFKKKMQGTDFFAAGFVFNNDKIGTSALKTNRYDLSFAYHKDLGGMRANYISIGFQTGLGQQSINLGSMSWDSQYDGLQYNAALPSMEGGGGSHIWFDQSVGLLYTGTGNDRFKNMIGISCLHLTRPDVGFMMSDRLYRKLNVHWTAQVALGANSNAVLVPTTLYSRQGPSQLINTGAGVKYLLQQRSRYTGFKDEKAITFGASYRLKDAASAYVRFDYAGWGIGFNYDFNISDLTVASKGVGALEFMAIYTGLFGSQQNTRRDNASFF